MSDNILVGSSKVTSTGQITIPQNIQKKFGIIQGDMIYFIEKDGELIIKKRTHRSRGLYATQPVKKMVGPSLSPILPSRERTKCWKFRKLLIKN